VIPVDNKRLLLGRVVTIRAGTMACWFAGSTSHMVLMRYAPIAPAVCRTTTRRWSRSLLSGGNHGGKTAL
jgi:hypothetical protein